MYFFHSWNILRVPCHLKNKHGFFQLCRKHKALPQLQVIKPDLSSQDSVNDTNKTKLKNKFVKCSKKLDSASVTFCDLQNTKNSKIINMSLQEWREMQLDKSKLGEYYLRLSKSKLTSLVVMTSMMGYAMAPNPFEIMSFLSCAIGTGLVSSAANSINQFLEIPFDAQMSRTRNRVLVQGYLSPLHAVGFATAAGTLGLIILWVGANGFTAALGASNLILYTMIYTPLKRISILNTWIGSIVGAIPPLMGWAACQGNLNASALILGGILYAWQFPHFNALSWNLRPDYSKAGYRMMAVTNPGLCRRTTLRYTLGITACSSLAPLLNITHWSFGVVSLPFNLYFVYLGFQFYNTSDSKNSRKLFRYSLLHLPLLLVLMLVTKEGLISSITANRSPALETSSNSSGKGHSSASEIGHSFSGLNLGTTLHAQVK